MKTEINSLNTVTPTTDAKPVKAKAAKPATKATPKAANAAAPVKKATPKATGTKAPAKAAKAAAPVTPAANAAAPSNVVEMKRGPGRPISEAQIKVRRRVEAYIQSQTENFTVKEMTKKLKLSRMHVSNAMRWAEGEKLAVRIGYKVEKRAGRKEVMFRPAHLPKLLKKDITAMVKAGEVEALVA